MQAPPSDGSPLEAVAETVGPAVAEAFKILGNETRMLILLALWEAYDPLVEDNSVSFTKLRNRIGVRQGGRFNYHLDKIVGHFVDRVEDGYVLRPSGLKLLETVIAGTEPETPLEPVEIDIPCPFCGGTTAITYPEDGELYHLCFECDGNFDWGQNVCGSVHVYDEVDMIGSPLSGVEFSPVGLAHRPPEELFAAARYALNGHHFMKSGGVCDECHGMVEAAIDICESHDVRSGRCDACGRRSKLRVTFVCASCKEGGGTTPAGIARYHPAVIAFLYDHGIHVGLGMNDFETLKRNRQLLREEIDVTENALATDPPRVEVTFRSATDGVRVMFDEALEVVEVTDVAGGHQGMA